MSTYNHAHTPVPTPTSTPTRPPTIRTHDPIPHARMVIIDRPQARNALNRATLVDLHSALVQTVNDPAIRVIILTGSDERAFVAGSDIKDLIGMSASEAAEFSRLGHETTTCLETADAVVIAAVNGVALGSGMELVLACDLVCMSEHAVLGLPEVGLGVIPGHGGTARLARWVGPARAKELLLTGRPINAGEAYRLGLAHRLVAGDSEAVRAEACALAHTLLTKSPQALATIKHLLRHQAHHNHLPQALEEETIAFANSFGTPDQREGMLAFIEKRPPHFAKKPE